MRDFVRFVAAGVCLAACSVAQGQTSAAPAGPRVPLTAPQAPVGTPGAPQANAATAEQAQAPAGPAAPVRFPLVDPKNFTAASPTAETVDSFLHAVWGLDENRAWRVASIQPANIPGFVRVEVYVADKRQPSHIVSYAFFTTPDGKHAVQGDLAPFGAHPFAETRETLAQRADGPARGAAAKDLELVEFTNLQCPSCKAAEGTTEQLLKDFPQAHIVYQSLPLPAMHPFAMRAAEIGQCVRQAKGDPAFFVYAQKVFDTQADLIAAKADATFRAAITAAGAEPAAVMTCAAAPAAQAAVESSVKLAADIGVTSVPTLVINGRIVPLAQPQAQLPYASLKRVIEYQGQLDGLAVKEQPSLTTLK